MSFFSALLVSVSLGLFQKKGKSPLTIWRREAAKILREALHQKSMATPRKTGANPLWLRFSPLNHDQPPLFPKKKGVSLSQPFFATKKIPSNNLPLQHSTTPWNTSLPLVQIWSPAPRAWYVLCCKPRKMPLWTLQNGQSRPPKRKTHLKQMESV